MTSPRQRSIEVRVPASTANLGAGFDCLGLALEMYLTARATVQIRPGSRTLARTQGVGSASLPKSPEQNLIFRAMRYTAEKEGFQLPVVRLAVKNEIPVAGGAALRPPLREQLSRTQQQGALSRERTRCDTRPKSKATQIMPLRRCME